MKEFFFRVAALAFEDAILRDLEGAVTQSIGQGDILSKMTSRTCLSAAYRSTEIFYPLTDCRGVDLTFLGNGCRAF